MADKRINIKPDPCFERIRKTFLLEGKPDRAPLCDFGIDESIMSWVVGDRISSCSTQALDFWINAGYDYVHMRPIYDFDLGRNNDRAWLIQKEGIGVIQTPDILHTNNWPWQKTEEFRYDHIVEMAKILPREMKLIISTGDIFTYTWESMGFTHFCNSLYECPELVEELFCQIGEANYLLNVRTAELVGDKIGAIWYTDDLAYNTGCFVNPNVYRKYLFPWVKKLADLSRSLNAPFLYHTDGNLWEIFDDFDKLGVCAIHPLEPKSMDAVEVKHKWGQRFCLIGNIDLDLLSRGTPEEVDQLVKDRIEKLGYDGGYCVGSSNTLANFVNPLNFKAMVEATFKYGWY